jgi:hypothetical protein
LHFGRILAADFFPKAFFHGIFIFFPKNLIPKFAYLKKKSYLCTVFREKYAISR